MIELLRLLVLHLVCVHLLLLVNLLAVHLVLASSSGRRVVPQLRVIFRHITCVHSVNLLVVLSVLLLLIIVHHHHSRQMTRPFSLRVVVANVVYVLFPYGLHVAYLIIRLHGSILVMPFLLLLLLLLLLRQVPVHVAVPSEIRMLLNLGGGHQYAGGDLITLVRVLWIVHLVFGELRIHVVTILWFVHRNLTDVRL